MSLSKPLIILVIVLIIAAASLWYTAKDNDRQAIDSTVDTAEY